MLLKRFGRSQHDYEMEQHKGLVDLKLVSKYFPEGNFSYPRPRSGTTEPLPRSRFHHHQASSSSSSVTSVPSLVDDDRSSVHSMEDDAHHHVTASGLWDSFWQPGQPREMQVASSSPYPAMLPLRTPPRRRASPGHVQSLPRDGSAATITAGHKRSASEETLLYRPATSPIKRKPVARQSRPPVRGSYSLFPPRSPPRRTVVPPRAASLAKPLPPTPLVVRPAKAVPLTSISEASGRSNASSTPTERSPVVDEWPAKAVATTKATATATATEPAPASPAFQPALPSPLNPNHQSSSNAAPPAAGGRRPSLPLFRPALPLRARSSSAVTVPGPLQGQPQPTTSSRPSTPATPPVLTNPFQQMAACPPPRGPPPPPPRAAGHVQALCSPPASPFFPLGHPHPSTPPPRALYTPIIIPTGLPTPSSPPSPRSLAPAYPPPPTPTTSAGGSFPPLMTPALPLLTSPGPPHPHGGLQAEEEPVSYFEDSDDEDSAEDGVLGFRRIARTLGLQHRQKGWAGHGGDKPARRRNYGRNDSTSSANTSFSSTSSANTSFSSAASARSSTSSSDGGSTITLATSRGPSWESQGPREADEMGLRDALRMLSPEDCIPAFAAPPAARPPRVRRQKSEVFTRMLGLRR